MLWLVRLAPNGFVGTKAVGEQVLQFWGLATPCLRAASLVTWSVTSTPARLRIATSFTRAMRRQLIGLFRDYQAWVRIVYVEATWGELLRRNRARQAPVPEAVLRRLAEKLEVPDLTEAHDLDYQVT